MNLRPALILALLALPVAARPVTPELLQSLPRLGECQLSPDGRWLALEVARTDLASGKTQGELRLYPWGRLGAPVARWGGASHPRWSVDGRQLLFEQASQAFAVRTGEWRPRQLTHQASGVEATVWSPDCRRLAFLSPVAVRAFPHQGKDSGRLYDDLFERRWRRWYDHKRLHLFVADLSTGQARDVTPGEVDAGPTSETFSSGDNHCFSLDGSALFYSAPPARGQAQSTNYDVYRLDLKSLQRQNLTQANPAADTGPRLSPDGRRLFIHSQTRPGYESDFYRVRSCAVDEHGVPQGEWRDEGVHSSDYHPTGKGGYFVELNGPAYQGMLREGERTVTLSLPGSLRAFSYSGGRWAAIQAALDQPPRLLEGEGERLIFAQDPEPLPKLELGAVESVQVPIQDGTMQMFLIKPPGFSPERRWPVAYLIHGGPQGCWLNDWSLRWSAQAWAARGYLVAMPNPHGSSDQGLAFQEEVSRDWGGRPYQDLMAGADYLAALPYVDSSRMLAAGASYGGYMVNWMAVHTGRFKALITHCGVWNLESMALATDELWFSGWEFGGLPWGGSPDYQKFSPHRFADQLGVYKTPHLVIHNELDFRVPLNQGLELFAALQLQGVPSRLLSFPDEGHHVLKPANSIRWYGEVFAFLGRYCPPGGR